MPLDPGPQYHGDLSHASSTNYKAQWQPLDLTHKFWLSQVWKALFHCATHSEEKPLKAEIWLGCQSHILPYSSAQLQPTFQLEGTWNYYTSHRNKAGWLQQRTHQALCIDITLCAAGKTCAQIVRVYLDVKLQWSPCRKVVAKSHLLNSFLTAPRMQSSSTFFMQILHENFQIQ